MECKQMKPWLPLCMGSLQAFSGGGKAGHLSPYLFIGAIGHVQSTQIAVSCCCRYASATPPAGLASLMSQFRCLLPWSGPWASWPKPTAGECPAMTSMNSEMTNK